MADNSPASFGALVAGANGFKQMVAFIAKDPAVKGVPVINEIALGLDAAMLASEALKANIACTAAIGY